MNSSNIKRYKFKKANEMRKVQDFTREELDEINQVKHIEENDDDINVNENQNLTQKLNELEFE
jgi:hypothetical protein